MDWIVSKLKALAAPSKIDESSEAESENRTSNGSGVECWCVVQFLADEIFTVLLYETRLMTISLASKS